MEQNEFSLKRLNRVPVDFIVRLTKTYIYMICACVDPNIAAFSRFWLSAVYVVFPAWTLPSHFSKLVIFHIFTKWNILRIIPPFDPLFETCTFITDNYSIQLGMSSLHKYVTDMWQYLDKFNHIIITGMFFKILFTYNSVKYQ